MRHTNRMVAVAGILACTIPVQADTILRQASLDLSQVKNPASFTLNNSKVLAIGTDTEGLTQAQMLFPGKSASLGRCSTTVSQDWSPYNILEVKMTDHEAYSAALPPWGLAYEQSVPNDRHVLGWLHSGSWRDPKVLLLFEH